MLRSKAFIAQFAVFLLPTLAALHNTLGGADIGRCMIWDSAHYIVSAKLLTAWLSELSAGHYSNPKESEIGYSLLLDGLVLPSIAAIWIYLGSLFKATTVLSLLVGECLLVGVNALLVFLVSKRLGFSRNLSTAGGLLWGFYPGQITAASRFMTEPLTVTASLTMVLLLARLLPRGRSEEPAISVGEIFTALGAGLTLILFAHLKSALLPAAACVLLLTLINLRPLKRAVTLIGIMAAAAFLMQTPWLLYSQVTMNHRTFVPDRMASYNLLVGLYKNVDGWATFPVPTEIDSQVKQRPMVTLVKAIKSGPFEFASLMARKLERLLKNNWNDFNLDSLGLSRPAQNLFHQLLLLGAGLGAVFLLVMERVLFKNMRQLTGSDLIKLSALLMVAGHLVFIFFEAQARYAFTAMPWMVILTLVGLDHLKHTWHSRAVGASCVIAGVLVVINHVEIAPLLVKSAGNIEAANSILNALLALGFSIWLTACCEAAEAKRVGGANWTGLTRGGLTSVSWLILGCAIAGSATFLFVKEQFAPPQEWVCQLSPGQSIERKFKIPASIAADWQTMKDCWALIAIDGSERVEGATIALNGKVLPDHPAPLFLEVEKETHGWRSESILLHETARAAGIKVGKIKQWRFIRIPYDSINWQNSENVLTLTAGKEGAEIFGQYNQLERPPALWGFSFGKWTFDGDMRVIYKNEKRAVPEASCLLLPDTTADTTYNHHHDKRDLAPAAGLQTGDYHFYLVVGHRDVALKPAQLAKNPMLFKDSFRLIF
jgi:hypothetical protein